MESSGRGQNQRVRQSGVAQAFKLRVPPELQVGFVHAYCYFEGDRSHLAEGGNVGDLPSHDRPTNAVSGEFACNFGQHDIGGYHSLRAGKDLSDLGFPIRARQKLNPCEGVNDRYQGDQPR